MLLLFFSDPTRSARLGKDPPDDVLFEAFEASLMAVHGADPAVAVLILVEAHIASAPPYNRCIRARSSSVRRTR